MNYIRGYTDEFKMVIKQSGSEESFKIVSHKQSVLDNNHENTRNELAEIARLKNELESARKEIAAMKQIVGERDQALAQRDTYAEIAQTVTTVSLEDFNLLKSELEQAKLALQAAQLAQMVAASINPQPTVSLEEFNKLKAELEQVKLALQAAQQFKPVVLDYQDKVRNQLDVVNDFINERLIRNSTASVLNYDMHFELIDYARERGCYINIQEVKGLLEQLKMECESSNEEYYYMGVELRQ
jgi:hypothetical protein